MKRPNPIHPDHLTPKERLGEVCAILGRGLVRLRLRNRADICAGGEFRLHYPPGGAVMQPRLTRRDA